MVAKAKFCNLIDKRDDELVSSFKMFEISSHYYWVTVAS